MQPSIPGDIHLPVIWQCLLGISELYKSSLGISPAELLKYTLHLADRYLQTVVNPLPSPDLGTNLGTTVVVLPGGLRGFLLLEN